MKNRNILLLIAAIVTAVILAACLNPISGFDNGYQPPPGYGAVRLNIGGVSNLRTILPTTPVTFLSYRLEFTTTDSAPAQNKDVTIPAASITDAIALRPGNYSLTVTANTSAGPAAFYIRSVPISIGQGSTESITITLTAFDPGNSVIGEDGTFNWIISNTMTELATATMGIYPIASGTPLQTVNLITNPSSSTDLQAGFYIVRFNFVKTGATPPTFQFHQTLWVYQNMTSTFAFTFTDNHFGVTPHIVTFIFGDGTPPDSSNSVMPSHTFDQESLTLPIPPSNAEYFSGWFTDTYMADSFHDFDCC
jgi:hypothetical protein